MATCSVQRRSTVTKAAIEPVWYLPGWRSVSDAARPSYVEPFSRRRAACTRNSSPVRTSKCSAADRRPDPLHLRRCARPGRSRRGIDGPRARRVQRLRRLRLRHLHVSPVPHTRHRRMHSGCATRRRRPGLLLRKEGRALGEVTKFPGVQTRASAKRAATPPTPTSPAPSASRGCRTCASRS